MNHAKSCIGLSKQINSDWKVGIIHSSYYKDEVSKLVSSAKEVLINYGINKSNILFYSVSGAFEIPLIGFALANSKKVNALIGFGIVVQGETQHAEIITKETARGMMDIQTKYGIPFAFEVIKVNSLDQAKERVELKGREAAIAVLSSLCILNELSK